MKLEMSPKRANDDSPLICQQGKAYKLNKHFLDLIHVSDTTALTLKESIYAVLWANGLSIQDIRGQGYDKASNTRGDWNRLKALVLNECLYAYYIHCMAYQL
jgi:hypothetical protein